MLAAIYAAAVIDLFCAIGGVFYWTALPMFGGAALGIMVVPPALARLGIITP